MDQHAHTYRQQIDHLEMEEARNLSLPKKYQKLMGYHLQPRESTRVYKDNENDIDEGLFYSEIIYYKI